MEEQLIAEPLEQHLKLHAVFLPFTFFVAWSELQKEK